MESKTEYLAVRMESSLKKSLSRHAEKNNKKISEQARDIIRKFLEGRK